MGARVSGGRGGRRIGGCRRGRHRVGYVGELDLSGTAPRFSAQTELALDHGPDFYAPQLVADGDRVLAWGWSWEGRGAGTNHRSAADIVECGWAGTLTFPREVVLTESGIAMCIPARELTGLVGEPITARQTESGWELRTSTPAWTLAAVDGVQLDLVDAATGHVRQVWSTAQPGEVRLFVENPEGANLEPVLVGLPFADIGDARLVLTDELIAAARSRLAPRGYGDGAEIDEDKISEQRSDDNG